MSIFIILKWNACDAKNISIFSKVDQNERSTISMYVCVNILAYVHTYVLYMNICIFSWLFVCCCVSAWWICLGILLISSKNLNIHRYTYTYVCICDTFWVKKFITRIFINLNFKIFYTNKIRWKCMYICSQLFVFSNFYALKRLLLFFHKKIFFSFPTMNGMSAVNLKCVNNKLQKKKLHLFDL